MHWRTNAAIHGWNEHDWQRVAESPPAIVAYIQALAVGGAWDRIPDHIRREMITAGTRTEDGRLGLAWVLGCDEDLLASVVHDPHARTQVQHILRIRESGTITDPAFAAMLDDAAPLPETEQDIQRMVHIGLKTQGGIIRLVERTSDAFIAPGAQRALPLWHEAVRRSTAEPLTAARAIIAMHGRGAWTHALESTQEQARQGVALLIGAVARMPEAAIACMTAGVFVESWTRAIPDSLAPNAVEALVTHWETWSEAQRAAMMQLAERSPAAAVVLARRIGPHDRLAHSVCTGTADHVAAYLEAIAPHRPSADHLDAVMRSAQTVPPVVAATIGLHPRIVYDALNDPHKAADALIAARQAGHPASSWDATLVNAIARDAHAAARAIRTLGPLPPLVESALRHAPAVPDLIEALHACAAQPDDAIIQAVTSMLSSIPSDDPSLAAHIAARAAALWDAPPALAASIAASSPATARMALRIACDANRWHALPDAVRHALLTAVAADTETRLATVADIGDDPILWHAHMDEAQRMSAAAPTSSDRRRAIMFVVARYLEALAVGRHWAHIAPERRATLLDPLLHDGIGLEIALRIVGADPAVVHALRSCRERRAAAWAEALQQNIAGTEPSDEAKQIIVAACSPNPVSAIRVTAALGWHPDLAQRVAHASYSDMHAYVDALRARQSITTAWHALITAPAWDDAMHRIAIALIDAVHDGESDATAASLVTDERSIGLALGHPCVTARYVMRHPDVITASWARTALYAATLHPPSTHAVHDHDLDHLGAVADAHPWSAILIRRMGVAGAGLDRIAADPELALIYLVHGAAGLLPHERMTLVISIAQASKDVRDVATASGIHVPVAAPPQRRR